jgi:hypothetical protein
MAKVLQILCGCSQLANYKRAGLGSPSLRCRIVVVVVVVVVVVGGGGGGGLLRQLN